MLEWKLVGPKIPKRVWRNHLLVARSFDREIVWGKLRRGDVKELRAAAKEGRPTLLVLHGTGLRTRMGTAGFSRADFRALQAQYGGCILAFEHRAVRHSLEKNARALVERLSSLGTDLRLHILGLSRGGLLARMITEGWVPCPSRIRVEKLIFLSTPNEGSLSARWDRNSPREMKAWRQDLRRLLKSQRADADASEYSEPQLLARGESAGQKLRAWPLLHGTGDQLPGSTWLKRLNGFSGPPRQRRDASECRYYGLASVFSFDHGAPNRLHGKSGSWKEIIDLVFSSTPNDLVVPTAGVYQPEQGPDACGRFPIPPERLLVMRPSCNITHIGMLWHPRVSSQVVDWLAEA